MVRRIRSYAARKEEIAADAADDVLANELDRLWWILIKHRFRSLDSVARGYLLRVDIEVEDLVQEACVGFMGAVYSYDEETEFDFLGHVKKYVKGYLSTLIDEVNGVELLPLDTFLPEELVAEPLKSDDGPDLKKNRLADLMSDYVIDEALEGAMVRLSDREADVLMRRYGIGSERPYSLQEIGLGYGMTRERVRQIEKSAMEKLKSAVAPCVQRSRGGISWRLVPGWNRSV
ncbi:hypothetical protein GCM10014719_31890 [Planomonospora parontospora subsp. antibiotica]|nr:hypothetical protein GCM10014719_31890 [Planomonospora parontospora subsp. antibiotica]GII16454.1 hypothetical protein Ppa05_31800 [Planomonospora parontospora subsp. antibiotica]